MEKRNYSQPMTKVMSMAVYGAVCDIQQGSKTSGPAHDKPLF